MFRAGERFVIATQLNKIINVINEYYIAMHRRETRYFLRNIKIIFVASYQPVKLLYD